MHPLRQAAVIVPLLLLVQSAVGVRRRLASVTEPRATFALPNFTVYHRQDELLREVVDIVNANPGFMKMDAFSERDGAYDAEVKVVTIEPGGFTNRHHEKVRMLLDFGEHGRELISSELGLLLLKTLASREGVLGVFPGELDRAQELRRLLGGTIIKVLPMENEGGRRLVEAGRLCERKNGRGVDPNRNWEVDWGTKEPDYDPNEEYPGTAPFSEPETKLLRQLAEEFKPHVWLNIHSGMEAMLAPWDHVAEIALEARPSVDILQRIFQDVMTNTTCVVGSGGKTVGYLAHGTATDYMFKILKVPIAYTWEIYGDFKAHFDDCFRMFNPLDEEGVKDVLQRWLRAIMRLVELMPSHPALKDSKAWTLPSSGGGGGDGSASGWTAEAGGAELTHQHGSDGGQGNVQGGGTAPTTGAGATTSSTTSTTSKTSSTTGSTTTSTTSTTTAGSQQEDGPATTAGASSSSSSSSSGGSTDDQPRIAVVASVKDWGSNWNAQLSSGLLAVLGLAVVGMLAYRCLSRQGEDPRRARGSGYQPV
ncbi:hypothetical protein VOLCADRAFT_120495 [Volvox carteri f. nagariensis]|uniref:Peptidase M14 domain-containing protein n=1 Tax=Volvox carteri f. nagariensis TaxID=3068 RepID=D8TMG6_VOLCA|nr:uncharacterized protein VOLCADRAFT_120495 [Volvox carteri f. nagariensis]EFJ51122.1 hypothetical protein VOLCADRAFT_120495 [Volvox carteri f. nagariensis]|eukprot:XP_002947589.1 hypothetical protein VOLCADRAFT_120495 [Volvox carteri f. nagariensis]